jgi:hypothetical protein
MDFFYYHIPNFTLFFRVLHIFSEFYKNFPSFTHIFRILHFFFEFYDKFSELYIF